jgi:maltoporin
MASGEHVARGDQSARTAEANKARRIVDIRKEQIERADETIWNGKRVYHRHTIVCADQLHFAFDLATHRVHF